MCSRYGCSERKWTRLSIGMSCIIPVLTCIIISIIGYASHVSFVKKSSPNYCLVVSKAKVTFPCIEGNTIVKYDCSAVQYNVTYNVTSNGPPGNATNNMHNDKTIFPDPSYNVGDIKPCYVLDQNVKKEKHIFYWIMIKDYQKLFQSLMIVFIIILIVQVITIVVILCK